MKFARNPWAVWGAWLVSRAATVLIWILFESSVDGDVTYYWTHISEMIAGTVPVAQTMVEYPTPVLWLLQVPWLFSGQAQFGFLVAFMASFLPLISAILASVALPLAVQLLPAVLGLAFFRWISRGAVLAGMTLGMLIVFFTEPPGLILFEGLFVDLPWGRWPLTIHSAAWGLAFNLLLVLLSSAATLRAPDSFQRSRLHDAMFQATQVKVGGNCAGNKKQKARADLFE